MRGLTRVVVLFWLILAISTGASAQDATADQNSDAGPAEETAYELYIVRSGDTLPGIAQRFSISVDEIRAINGLAEAQSIAAGQSLLVPGGSMSFIGFYDVKPGDTLYGISRRFDTSIDVLLSLNNIADAGRIEAGQRLVVPSADQAPLDIYVVGADDSLSDLAKRFHTTVAALRSINGIADEDDVEAGQSILAPRLEEAQFEVYEVKPADSLYSIAKRFATSEQELMALNGIADASAIEAGKTILVPRIDERAYEAYTVADGDSLFGIARIYNTTVAQLRALNGIEGGLDLTVGRVILVPRVDETLLERYVVQAGDSLYTIARRYGVGLSALQALNQLADVRDIKVDQVIFVPKLEDIALEVHVVGRGDTLATIAEAYGTSVEILQALNGIANPSLIRQDDTLVVPQAKATFARPGFGFGIHVFVDGSNAGNITYQMTELGANWAKVDVSWAEVEPAAGIFNYSELDAMLASLELSGLNIMLNVYDAPDWSRSGYLDRLNSQLRGYSGPPEDLAHFGNFMANMVRRYAGVVDAYEIWKSPNLLKYWTTPVYLREPEIADDGEYGLPEEIDIGAEYYVPLLAIAYDTIKAHDEAALVISAGLAPVGYTDNYNAIDTDSYLTNMLQAGAAEVSDGIGAIFSASAVPPTMRCCTKPPGVESHYESFLQYFTDLLAYYDQTMGAAGVELPIFVTQVGWGTREGANLAVPASGYEWLNYTSEAEQALYVSQAFQIAQSLEYVAAMFLHNLNGCLVGEEEACFFSLVDADAERRPAFDAYAAVPKTAEAEAA